MGGAGRTLVDAAKAAAAKQRPHLNLLFVQRPQAAQAAVVQQVRLQRVVAGPRPKLHIALRRRHARLHADTTSPFKACLFIVAPAEGLSSLRSIRK